MNKKMKAIQKAMQDKFAQARKAQDEGRSEDAAKLMDECDALQKDFELEKRLYERERAMVPDEPEGEDPGDPDTRKEISGFAIIAKLLRRQPLSDEERAAREEKRETRQEKRDRLKQKALDKTPDKLRNPSDLQVRFRTGVIYTAATVICVLAGNIPMVLMLMVVAGICAGEFFYMLRSDAKLPNEMLGIIAAVLYPLSVYIAGLVGAMLVSLALLLALLVWYVFWLRARIPDVGVSFFGAAYTGLLLCGLVIIRVSLPAPWGGVCVLLLFLSVWANDAFAYLVGSKIGRHKLAPRTSPKKSWEGFIAGLVGSVIFWCLMTLVPGITMAIPQSIVFGIISGCMGVLGDLAESRIKRNSGFKDSGTIMPGHGGLLDRSDSLFLTSITAAILLIAGGCIPYALF